MAIERKSELRTVEILFNQGSLVSIQSTFFERLEEDGAVVPGTFNNRVAPFDPESAEGKQIVEMLGAGALAGIKAKDEALQAAYQELDLMRTQLANRDGGLQQQLDAALAESNRLKKQISDFTAAIQPSQG